MDQYWVWMRRRQILNSINKDSREEKAIMEDASDQLGGCIWPPRSYSCSFCRREFRSAQALGGHMNVHRRDRARLKQSLSPCNNIDTPFQHQNPIPIASTPPLKSMDSLFSPEICTLDYDLDLTSSRVSAQESLNHDQHSTIASSFSSFSRVQEQPKGCPNSMSKLHVSSSSPRGEDLTRLSNNISNTIAANLFMGLKPTKSTTVLRDDHKAISDNCKRLKTTVSTLSFLMNPCSNDKCSLQLGVVGENPSSIEDIDLELRLGELPKVK